MAEGVQKTHESEQMFTEIKDKPKPQPKIAHPRGRNKPPGSKGLWCSYCGHRVFTRSEKPDPTLPRQHQASRDHILPRSAITPEIVAWLQADYLGFGPVTNLRWSCVRCDGDRSSVGHCPGALAAARSFNGGLLLLRRGNNVKRLPPKIAASIFPPGSTIVAKRGGITVYRSPSP